MQAPPIMTRAPLSVASLKSFVESTTHGAIVTFEGVVRGEESGEPITAIEYEAYEPMAAEEIARIIEEGRAKWPCAIAVQHRVGRVAVGEASLVVAVGSRHRKDAIEAAAWVIDRIKALAPIWKTTFEKGIA